MMDSELECKVLSNENRRLRDRVRGLTILIYALATLLGVFIGIATILGWIVGGNP